MYCYSFCEILFRTERLLAQLFQYTTKIRIIMKNTLFITAGIFFTAWIVGFFFIGAGPLIHTLALFAVIFCLQGIITTPKSIQETKIKS